MVHVEAFFDELVLCGDHIVVIVVRKFRVQAVAGLARFSVANAVGNDDVITRDVEQAVACGYDGGAEKSKTLTSANINWILWRITLKAPWVVVPSGLSPERSVRLEKAVGQEK